MQTINTALQQSDDSVLQGIVAVATQTDSGTGESTIRDADLAAESANLTRAQILLQAGVAALAQANSAPQQILSLLQHQ